MRLRLPMILLLGCAVAAPAQAMNVSEFLTRADALQSQGVMALFSPDYKVLKQEVKSAGNAIRADQQAARAAGRKAATCMPEEKVPVDPDELLAYFRAIPAPQRSQSVAAAFTGMMKRKYPCPA